MVLALTDMEKLPTSCGECELCYDMEYCMAHGNLTITMFRTRPTECPLIEREGSTIETYNSNN